MFQEHWLALLSCLGLVTLAIGLAWNRRRAERVRVSAVTLSRLNRRL